MLTRGAVEVPVWGPRYEQTDRQAHTTENISFQQIRLQAPKTTLRNRILNQAFHLPYLPSSAPPLSCVLLSSLLPQIYDLKT